MTTITFGFYALGKLDDGRIPVHMYLRRLEPTYTESPGEEHRAMKDAADTIEKIVSDQDGVGTPEDQRLLQAGDPPEDAKPVIQFAIGVTWDRATKSPHYTKVCHQRVMFDSLWNPVATVAMDLYEYIFSVLRAYEKERRRRGLEKIARSQALT